MAILITGNTFANGDQVTFSSLNNAVNNASFATDAIDPNTMQFLATSPNGLIAIKDAGVSTAKIANDAIIAAKIADATITPAKLSTGAPSWTSTALNVANSLDFSAVTTAASGTYGRSLLVVTVTMTAHGMVTGNIATLVFSSGTGGSATNGSYVVTVSDANTFTITDTVSGAITGSPSVSRTSYYGNSTIRGSEIVNGNLTVAKSISGSSGTLSVTGDASIAGALTVAGSDIKPLTLATAQASTTSNPVSFNDIPSWVKRITIMFAGVSTDGAGDIEVVLGTGSSGTPVYVSSGYSGGGNRFSSTGTSGKTWTSGFLILTNAADNSVSGHMTLTKLTGNYWVASSSFGSSLGNFSFVSGGFVNVAAALTQVRIKTTAGNSFDTGTLNIIYD